MKSRYLIIIISILAIFIIAGLVYWSKKSSDQIQIIFYTQGKSHQIPPDEPQFPIIVSTMEELLRTADDAILLAVDTELIKSIKKERETLELIYPTTVKLPVFYTGTDKELDRLLIPLNGPQYATSAAIIYCSKGWPHSWYESGPFSNQKGTAELESLVNSLYKFE